MVESGGFRGGSGKAWLLARLVAGPTGPSYSVVEGRLAAGAPPDKAGQGDREHVPEVLEQQWIDEVVTIEEAVALSYTRRLAREEGLLVGPSSGANVAAALQVAEDLGAEKRLVTLLCDTGFRYFSVEGFVNESEASPV